jgi:D-beta-D-heptose 7-phosphate kinase/D-beta-D-heptose 1-phosphate adenosyltransferase
MLERFLNVNVLVVGDVMLDRFWWGSVKRISPEAPVPVVNLQKSTFAPGGAANVALNIAGLGARPILVGVVGTDHEGNTLSELLKENGVSAEGIIRSDSRPTTVKTRVVAHNQQIVRVDQETTDELSAADFAMVWDRIVAELPGADIVVISDYAKGLLSEDLTRKLIATAVADSKKVLVDPKGKDYGRYAGAALLTPNKREAAEACNFHDDMPDLVNVAGERLMSELDLEMALITQGEEGMTLFQKGQHSRHLSAAAHEVYDVTGAGDTVVACLGVGLGAGLGFLEAATIANISAGLVVEQVGTTAITREMLEPILAEKPLAQTLG